MDGIRQRKGRGGNQGRAEPPQGRAWVARGGHGGQGEDPGTPSAARSWEAPAFLTQEPREPGGAEEEAASVLHHWLDTGQREARKPGQGHVGCHGPASPEQCPPPGAGRSHSVFVTSSVPPACPLLNPCRTATLQDTASDDFSLEESQEQLFSQSRASLSTKWGIK